jgi:biotin synthase-related radical SAM superfamily protein
MVLVITMSMEWHITGIFLLKSYYPNVATYIPDRYDEDMEFHLKGLTLQMMAFPDHCLRLRYKITRSCRLRNEISILSSVITTDLDKTCPKP